MLKCAQFIKPRFILLIKADSECVKKQKFSSIFIKLRCIEQEKNVLFSKSNQIFMRFYNSFAFLFHN